MQEKAATVTHHTRSEKLRKITDTAMQLKKGNVFTINENRGNMIR